MHLSFCCTALCTDNISGLGMCLNGASSCDSFGRKAPLTALPVSGIGCCGRKCILLSVRRTNGCCLTFCGSNDKHSVVLSSMHLSRSGSVTVGTINSSTGSKFCLAGTSVVISFVGRNTGTVSGIPLDCIICESKDRTSGTIRAISRACAKAVRPKTAVRCAFRGGTSVSAPNACFFLKRMGRASSYSTFGGGVFSSGDMVRCRTTAVPCLKSLRASLRHSR